MRAAAGVVQRAGCYARAMALRFMACLWLGVACGAPRPAGEGFAVPEWAQGAVWYQVFPERFDNGNPANDSTTPGSFKPGWTDDFYAVSRRELESGRAAAMAWGRTGRVWHAGSALAQVVPFRRYGGDLQGVVRRLDELKELGVTAIYLSPVFQARSEHKYETSDHRHVDESLGNTGPARAEWRPDPLESADPLTWRWTEADRYLIDVLLPEARKRGLRVVLDGVWNHVGTQHWAFQDVMRNGRASAYADWFQVRFTDDGRVLEWVGWPHRANGDLPQFRQTAEGDLAPGPKAYVFAVTRRWMDPNGDGDPSDGIDGWRLDVAPDVPIAFWQDWHALVKAINPRAVTIGEIWMPADRWIEAGCFDAQMNYPLAMALVEWLRGGRDGAWLKGRMESIIGGGEAQPDAHDLAQMNLLAGHDTERLASMIENPGSEYDSGRGVLGGTPGYRAGRASEATYDRVVLAYALLAALPGSPMVFQGDEWGMTGGDDPECRKPVAWPELGPYASVDDAPVEGLGARIGGWLRLRSDGDVGEILRMGSVVISETYSRDMIVVCREREGRSVVVIVNRGDSILSAAPILRSEGVRVLTEVEIPARTAVLWELP